MNYTVQIVWLANKLSWYSFINMCLIPLSATLWILFQGDLSDPTWWRSCDNTVAVTVALSIESGCIADTEAKIEVLRTIFLYLDHCHPSTLNSPGGCLDVHWIASWPWFALCLPGHLLFFHGFAWHSLATITLWDLYSKYLVIHVHCMHNADSLMLTPIIENIPSNGQLKLSLSARSYGT